MFQVLGKGILYLVVKFSPEVNTLSGGILSKLLRVSFGGVCLGVMSLLAPYVVLLSKTALISGLSLGSYSHDAEWSFFQGRPLVAVLTTAFFTIRLIDLAKLLVKIPGFNALHDLITMPDECQGDFA